MKSYFTAEFFKGNRRNLRKLFTGTAPIVLTANGLLQRSGDSTYEFHQDSSFWYLTGINEADAVLVMDKEKEYLIVNKRAEGGFNEAFDGATDFPSMADRSGIELILDSKEGLRMLGRRLKKSKHVAILPPAQGYSEHYRFYSNPARARLIEQIKKVNPRLTHLDIKQHLTKLRATKQPEEIRAIKSAVSMTVASFKEISRNKKSLVSEPAIEAKLTYGLQRRGADGHAYQPIVAGGINATTLHYIDNNDDLNSKELLLIDAGAEIEHYAADITRIFATTPLTKRQQAVFDAVVAVHAKALEMLKPGVLLKDYENVIEQFMGEKLRELGLIKLIDHDNVRAFYPHATSHFLGLDVHDVGEYDQPLGPGMILTVEPGIYIPKERLGIRLEDDVLITKNGVQVLSKNLPHLL